MGFGGYMSAPESVTLIDGTPIDFEYKGQRILMKNLPKTAPDPLRRDDNQNDLRVPARVVPRHLLSADKRRIRPFRRQQDLTRRHRTAQSSEVMLPRHYDDNTYATAL